MKWYVSTSTVLEEHGWRRLNSDPCCWRLIDPDLIELATHKELRSDQSVPWQQVPENKSMTWCSLDMKEKSLKGGKETTARSFSLEDAEI